MPHKIFLPVGLKKIWRQKFFCYIWQCIYVYTFEQIYIKGSESIAEAQRFFNRNVIFLNYKLQL